MAEADSFQDLARFYDALMAHVNYDRWIGVITRLADALPRNFLHVDLACGTGTILKRLRQLGWQSVGIDLSVAMLKAGKKDSALEGVAAGDFRALPLRPCAHLVSCLFDSLNFLLTEQELRKAFYEVAATLNEKGLFYFDLITERMVTEHFAGQQWVESNGKFWTSWESDYCPKTRVSETRIRFGRGPLCVLRERAYTQEQIEAALHRVGLHLITVYDVETGGPPRRKTTRMEFIATRSPSGILQKAVLKIVAGVMAEFAR